MKKILTLLLAIVIVTFVDFGSYAKNSTQIFCSISDGNPVPNEEISFIVSFKESVEVKSMALVFSYDINVFELIGGEWLIDDALISNFDDRTTVCGTAATVYTQSKNIHGDVFLLRLKVKESAERQEAEIIVSPVIKNNSSIITCEATSIGLTIREAGGVLDTHTPGDINGDGKVNNKDLTRLFQYLSDWDVEVNETALDVNGDGKINNKDLTRLFQYLSDWDVEIY